MSVSNRTIALLLVSLSVLAIVGCRDGMNDASFNVAGTVKHKDQPVPVGFVRFIPKGPGGVVGFVKIVDGKFDTAEGKKTRGVEAGDYSIKVEGFDGVPPADAVAAEAYPNGKPLFSQYVMNHSFQADTTLDIVVPSK